MRHSHTMICALCAAFSITAAADWQIDEDTDEITDQLSYYIVSKGDKYQVSDFLNESPYIILKITPAEITDTGALKYKFESYFQVKSDGMNRHGIIATVRFDKNPPEEWLCETSTDRRSAFFPKARDPIGRLSSATNLIIRFETTLGAVRTLHFDVSGLKQKLLELKNNLAAKYPRGLKFIKPKEISPPPAPKPPKCAKCGGTGEVVTWKRCRRCYGSGTNGGAPCPKCGNSGRKGFTRHAAPCANCYDKQ